MQRKIKIIAVGKVKYSWIQAGIQEYGKRIPGLNLQEIKDSNRRTELSEITPYLKTHDRLIVLTERGKLQTSQDFSQFLITETLNHSLSQQGFLPTARRISTTTPICLTRGVREVKVFRARKTEVLL